MAIKLQPGTVIPEFRYDTPYRPQQSFYQLVGGDKPVMLIFLRNFGHPITRHYIMEYMRTAELLTSVQLVCVVRTRPQVIAEAMPEEAFPYQLMCDAEGVLYDYFSIEQEKNWLRSYSIKTLKIIKEAKKRGFQEDRSKPQQLPLTILVGKEGEVLFAHYGSNLTDLPEDCNAIQRVSEAVLARELPDLEEITRHLNHAKQEEVREEPAAVPQEPAAVPEEPAFASETDQQQAEEPIQKEAPQEPDPILEVPQAPTVTPQPPQEPENFDIQLEVLPEEEPSSRKVVAGSKTIDLAQLGFGGNGSPN